MDEYVWIPPTLLLLFFGILLVVAYAGTEYFIELSQPDLAKYYCVDKLGGEWVNTAGPNSCLVCEENYCKYLTPRIYKGQLKWMEKE